MKIKRNIVFILSGIYKITSTLMHLIFYFLFSMGLLCITSHANPPYKSLNYDF